MTCEYRGESPSHLKFFVKSAPHKLFMRDGDDLHIDVHIDLMEALFGFTRTIEQYVHTPSAVDCDARKISDRLLVRNSLDGHAVDISRNSVTKPGAKEVVKSEGMPVRFTLCTCLRKTPRRLIGPL